MLSNDNESPPVSSHCLQRVCYTNYPRKKFVVCGFFPRIFIVFPGSNISTYEYEQEIMDT